MYFYFCSVFFSFLSLSEPHLVQGIFGYLQLWWIGIAHFFS